MNAVILKRTVHECGRVALAKWFGHDPHGMGLRDRPWREVVRLTYRAHCESYEAVRLGARGHLRSERAASEAKEVLATDQSLAPALLYMKGWVDGYKRADGDERTFDRRAAFACSQFEAAMRKELAEGLSAIERDRELEREARRIIRPLERWLG